MTLQLTSTAFREGQSIPTKHTGDGADLSPALSWTNAPDGTGGFALICDDPDAPHKTWVHWVLFNMPADQSQLEEGIPSENTLPSGAKHGKNDFGNPGYGGPAPPPGKPHRYYFKLYALDVALTLAAGATKDQVLAAMKGHVLAEVTLMGKYQR